MLLGRSLGAQQRTPANFRIGTLAATPWERSEYATIMTGFFRPHSAADALQALSQPRVSPRAARYFPHWYHRQACKLVGVRLTIEGQVMSDTARCCWSRTIRRGSTSRCYRRWRQCHLSPSVRFRAGRSCRPWRAARDRVRGRERRGAVGDTTQRDHDAARTGRHRGFCLPRERSSDGNRVLPFRASLFGAKPSLRPKAASASRCRRADAGSIVFTRLQWRAVWTVEQAARRVVRAAWKCKAMLAALKAGPLDVRIRIGEPIPLEKLHRQEGSGAQERGSGAGRHVRRPLRGRPDGALQPLRATSELRQAAISPFRGTRPNGNGITDAGFGC